MTKYKNFVLPKIKLIGSTQIDLASIKEYLEETDQIEFLEEINEATENGLDVGEILVSFFAKSCYASLTTKKNKNITRVRAIEDNIKSVLQSGHGCYDEKTEVLTKEGWKFWSHVSLSDEFATVNGSGRFEWQKPVKLFKYDYSGDMISYNNSSVDLLVTPNHNMFICETSTKEGRKKEFKSFKLEKAENLLSKSHSLLKTLLNVKKETYYMPMYQLLGFSIGDANINGNRLQFHLKKERKIQYLKNICKKLGIEIQNKEDFYNINLNDVGSFKSLFYSIYLNKEKVIPKEIFNDHFDDTLILHSLYNGLINSDGSVYKTGFVYDTTSYILAGDIQTLCNLIGYGSNISQAECYKNRESSFGDKPIYRIYITTRNIKPEFNKSKKDIYKKNNIISNWNGKVYCAEVPNHTLFVRRNGKTVWCGNSVLEHVSVNFMVSNCSRVFTHELVRHRVGTAFSQTSGRYVRTDKLDLVIDPILEPGYDIIEETRLFLENQYKKLEQRFKIDDIKDFATKKKLTSAFRRILCNAQANEIGFTLNIRTLRHLIELRTSRHAEWEIRLIFNQIYKLVKKKYPVFFFDAKSDVVDGLEEITFEYKKV